MSNAVEYSKL